MTPETLACFVPFSQPQRRETLINAYKALISSPDSWQSHNATGHLFTILRSLKISDVKICNMYWNRVIAELDVTPEEVLQLRFLKHCHRYMNFNNNLGGTYRPMHWKRNLVSCCMSAIEHDIAGRIPQKFARLPHLCLPMVIRLTVGRSILIFYYRKSLTWPNNLHQLIAFISVVVYKFHLK
ncbi:hypothetical protein DOY81_011617 [Sarcophaga bullata]|nr:hypothetical protein DOY81_011617 [Sarcophaga bullata]